MAILGESVFSRCGTHAGLAALIGSGTNARCWPEELPEAETLPAVEFHQIGQDNSSYRDRGGTPDWATMGVRFSCYGTSVDQARILADQMVACWDGHQGDGCDVGLCFVTNRIQLQSLQLDLFREIIDVDVLHSIG